MTRIWREHRAAVLIVAAYLILATIYSLVTPPFEASDELWHYPMIAYIADNGLGLPVQDPAVSAAWRQEGSQPPLYYMMAGALTSWIDTSDLDHWRRINPHADIGIVRPDGNANMIVHRPDESDHRFGGALLALQISRWLSVALSAGTVVVTYLLGRALFPAQRLVAPLAMAFNACLPMFLFISGSANNDNLSNLLGNLLTLLVARLLMSQEAPRTRDYVVLGLVTGAGLLAKFNLGFFIPIIALSLLWISLRRRDWRPLVIGGAVSGALTIVVAGWWYLRNAQLYGDPTGLNVFLDIVGRRAIPANAAQLWSERDSFLQAFWGFFGGMNVPLPTDIYTIYNLLAGIGLVGALAYVVWRTVGRRVESRLSIAHWMTLLWIAITFVSYLRWTAETPASQGRLVFGALSAICVWLALGWSWWLPRRGRFLAALPVAFTAVVAVFAALLILPLTPVEYTFAADEQLATFTEPDGDGAIVIQALDRLPPTVRPEEYVNFTLINRFEGALTHDWSLFVHLVTPDGVIIGQRDVYPAGGLIATSDPANDEAWLNPVAVWVPDNAYAPQTLDVVIGFYDLQTGERMMLPDGEETFTLGQVDLLPRFSDLDVPNPITINFAHQVELVGYALSDLSPAQGDEVTLTLYWRGLAPLQTDYVVFAQIIDPITTTIYAASDAMPAAWERPTTTWVPGEIVEDAHTLTVSTDAPPGIYEIYVGLYTRGEDGSFNRLRVVTADGGQAFDYTQLSRVRIVPEGS
ncbi:MAG: DUF2142 domain-containing protein [Anaerolineae bacterium]|nr:DUF2142 domain-containing protein [Anaerolineae bacterium]